MGKKRNAIKPVERADIKASRAAAAARDTPAVTALGWFGKLTDQPPLYAFIGGIAVAAAIRRDRKLLKTSAHMLAAHWLGIRGKDAAKLAVDRTRPQMLLDEGRYEAGKGARFAKPFNSFPSGHTTGAVAIARVIARDYPDYRLPAYALATLAGLARVAKADHFVSDTAAGALIGWAAERLSLGSAPAR